MHVDRSGAPDQTETGWMAPETRMTLLFHGLLFLALLLSHWVYQLARPERGLFIAGALAGACALAVGWAALCRRLDGLFSWPSRLYGVLLIWSTLSFAWSVLPGAGLDTMGTWLLGYWVMVAAALSRLAVGEMQRSYSAMPGDGQAPFAWTASPQAGATLSLFVFFALLVLFAALKGLHQYLFAFDEQRVFMETQNWQPHSRIDEAILHALREKRIVGWYGNPNVFCYVLAMGTPFLIGLAAGPRALWARFLWALGLAPVLAAAYLTKSRGGWIALALTLALAVGLMGPRRRRALWAPLGYAMGLSALCLLVFWLANPYGASQNRTGAAARQAVVETPREQQEAGLWKRLTRVSTVRERLYYMEAAWRQLSHSPWTPLRGNGLGSFGTLYLITKSPDAGESIDVHNTPLQLLVEGGALPLALVVALYLMAMGAAWRGRRRDGDGPGALPVSTMCLAALAAFGVGSLVDIAFYQSREFFLTGFLLIGWLLGGEAAGKASAESHVSRPAYRPGALAMAVLVLWGFVQLMGGWMFLYQPMRAKAYALQGDKLVREGQFELAFERFRQASERNGLNARYVAEQATVLDWMGAPDAALETRRQAMLLNPWSAAIRRDQAGTLLTLGRPDEALALADEAIALYPSNPEGYVIRARALHALGRRDEEAAMLGRAAELEPHDPEKYRRMEAEVLAGGDVWPALGQDSLAPPFAPPAAVPQGEE